MLKELEQTRSKTSFDGLSLSSSSSLLPISLLPAFFPSSSLFPSASQRYLDLASLPPVGRDPRQVGN